MSLKNVKILLGLHDSSKDELLQILIDQAKQQILAYTNRDELPNCLESIADRLAVIFYNRQGTEGELSRSEGAISQSFETLPTDLTAVLNRYRKAGVLCDSETKT